MLSKAIRKLSPREQTIIALDLVWERRMLQRKHRKRLQTFWEFLNHIFPGWKKGIMKRLKKEISEI